MISKVFSTLFLSVGYGWYIFSKIAPHENVTTSSFPARILKLKLPGDPDGTKSYAWVRARAGWQPQKEKCTGSRGRTTTGVQTILECSAPRWGDMPASRPPAVDRIPAPKKEVASYSILSLTSPGLTDRDVT